MPRARPGLTWALQNLFISSSLARRMRVRHHVGYLVMAPEVLAKVSRVCGKVGPVSSKVWPLVRNGGNWEGEKLGWKEASSGKQDKDLEACL